VNFTANQYFSLIVPLCALLQGLALICCWSVIRQQRYLLWVAASYILMAIPLSAHSLMSVHQLAQWAVPANALYLFGMWASARGIASKYGGDAHPIAAAGIMIVALAGSFYFSYIDDQLWIRLVCLNVAIVLLLSLGIVQLFRTSTSHVLIERILRYSFLMVVGYAVIRTLVVIYIFPSHITNEITRSGFWLAQLAVSLVVSLLFTFSLLASVMREMLQTLKNERNQDPLTRLLNRRAFFEQAEQRLRLTPNDQWALIVCDIDHFKQVNDNYGHAAGDQALLMVGAVLVQQVRQNDLVARFGGEEFVILINCQDMLLAKSVAERMRLQIMATQFPAIPERLSASFGVTLIMPNQSISDAIECADTMLYHAKRSGRNQVAYVGAAA
jgi:diguanylate cyclase (GGDEF)-like protein